MTSEQLSDEELRDEFEFARTEIPFRKDDKSIIKTFVDKFSITCKHITPNSDINIRKCKTSMYQIRNVYEDLSEHLIRGSLIDTRINVYGISIFSDDTNVYVFSETSRILADFDWTIANDCNEVAMYLYKSLCIVCDDDHSKELKMKKKRWRK